MRIVDIAFPAYGGARFFEIHAHDDEQLVVELLGDTFELLRILHGLVMVVNGAGAHHNQQPIVAAVQYVGNGLPVLVNLLHRVIAQRQAFLQQGGRYQGAHGLHAHIVDAGGIVGRRGCICRHGSHCKWAALSGCHFRLCHVAQMCQVFAARGGSRARPCFAFGVKGPALVAGFARWATAPPARLA